MELDICKQKRVLYVEDNKDVREITEILLSNLFDIVDVAVDGKKALELFNKNSYDIVITDVNMPNMNGLTLSKNIKNIKRDVYIIVISGAEDLKLLQQMKETGEIDDILIKPISLDKLIDSLKEATKGE